MSKRKGKRTRRNPWDGLRKAEIAERWPFKLPIIEHLVSERIKIRGLLLVLEALKMKVKTTSDGAWFDIVGG